MGAHKLDTYQETVGFKFNKRGQLIFRELISTQSDKIGLGNRSALDEFVEAHSFMLVMYR